MLCICLYIFTILLQSECFRVPFSSIIRCKRYVVKADRLGLKAVSSIQERSKECLDLSSLIKVLQSHTVTRTGNDQVGSSFYQDAPSVVEAYKKVNQLYKMKDFLPLSSSVDLQPLIQTIESHSRSLEEKEIASIALEFEHMMKLHTYMEENAKFLSLFSAEIQNLQLPLEVIHTFNNSFNEKHKLNNQKYPALQRITQSIKILEKQIGETMHRIVTSSTMKEKLADS
jgi:dsDNA-specific endonuclease/ATPase MutS2